MYILIEHNGSKEHTQEANKIAKILEDEYGFTTEQVIGSQEQSITLYTDDLKKVYTGTKIDYDYLRLLVGDL